MCSVLMVDQVLVVMFLFGSSSVGVRQVWGFGISAAVLLVRKLKELVSCLALEGLSPSCIVVFIIFMESLTSRRAFSRRNI